ncbi:MAG: hypothetical protein JWM53_5404 [bacterium]|nr:hypothetical protein [bacterium]
MKEQLKRAAQALEADAAVGAAPATAEADGGGGAGAHQQRGIAGKAQQRAKKADDYHARHRDWVAQFNELTGGECAGGEGGVKWAAVRAWQQKHWQANNLLADGLVGPKTIEAAKIVAKKSGAKDEKKDGKDGGAPDEKEKQHEPQPGQADGAEASADKPKLDEEEPEGDVDQQTDGAADFKAEPSSTPAKHGKHATVGEFQAKLDQIAKLLDGWKAPEGSECLPQTALAKADGHAVEDPTKQAEAHGAMMQHLSEYRSEIDSLIPSWTNEVRAPERRAHDLTTAINHALATEKVHPVEDAVAKLSGHAAHFDAAKWTMTVGAKKLENPSPKASDVHDIASDVFHEGRHAEQRFNVARLMASKGDLTAEMISTQAGISLEAVKKAVSVEKEQPMAPNAPEKKDAAAFFDDTVVHGEAHSSTERVAKAVNTLGPEARALFDALSPHDQAAMKAKWEEFRIRMFKVFDAYQRLPTEKDSFAAEKQLGLSENK